MPQIGTDRIDEHFGDQIRAQLSYWWTQKHILSTGEFDRRPSPGVVR